MAKDHDKSVQQLSEVYRRGVCFPLDDLTEQQLRSWWTTPEAKVQYLPIDDETAFYGLWEFGVVPAVNQSCHTNLDDYEETMMEHGDLGCVIKSVRASLRGMPPGATRKLCEDMLVLLGDAHANHRPVFWIL